MSEIGLNINVDSYNNEGIKTIKGNNNAEIYKLYILKNKRRLSLVDKTVKLGYVMAGTTKGDIIENLNITNVEQGEITFPITNRISKQDGVYSCQLAIYGADGFLEHTATFGLTVEANIFTKIAGEIADSKDFTYLENILDKASKLSEKLKENTSSATNANSNLESNIIEANNINSKLLENTSTATSLNKNLESNIDLAKEVKETIKDLDNKNIETTEKIETLTGLNSKAEELSDNINKGLPLNSELVKNVESAKTANNELIATNNDAKTKKTDLDNSLEEAKKYISGLDGSKNPVQMQLDINELKNGLKSNQALAYKGSSIAANNTLEGRTEGMRIGGRTLVNLAKSHRRMCAKGASAYFQLIYPTLKVGTYTVIINASELTKEGITMYDMIKSTQYPYSLKSGLNIRKIEVREEGGTYAIIIGNDNIDGTQFILESLMILEGDWTKKLIPKYFEGLKSFGEAEQERDKYKISLISYGKNLFNINSFKSTPQATLNNGLYITPKPLGSYSVSNLYSNENRDKLLLKPNTTYICSALIRKTNGNGEMNYLSIITTPKNSATVSGVNGNWLSKPSLNSDFQRFVYKFTTGNNVNIDYFFAFQVTQEATNLLLELKEIQIEQSEEFKKYQDYKENKKDILIKEPLKSVGDIKDIIYEDDGKVKIDRYVGKIIINGNSDDGNNYIYYSDKRFIINIRELNINKKDRAYVLCDKLPYNYSAYSTIGQYGISGYGDSSASFVGRWDFGKTVTDRATFIEYLKTNPITIYYELDTPVTEVVENCVDIDLDTFQEKTYFSIENSLPGTLDFKVPSNIGSVVQNMAKEVNNIWDVINNLLVPSIVKANGNLAMIKLNNNLK